MATALPLELTSIFISVAETLYWMKLQMKSIRAALGNSQQCCAVMTKERSYPATGTLLRIPDT